MSAGRLIVDVKSPWIFFGACGAIVLYLLYMMIRKYKVAPAEVAERDSEL